MAVSRVPTNVVNNPLTIFSALAALACGNHLCHGVAMVQRKTTAGGCFLSLCILAGFPVGLAMRNPLKGVLIGTGIGIVIAVGLWLADRRQQGK